MTSALASLLMLQPIRTATRLTALLLPEPSSVRHRTSTPVAHNEAPDFEVRAGTCVNAAELHSARPPAFARHGHAISCCAFLSQAHPTEIYTLSLHDALPIFADR